MAQPQRIRSQIKVDHDYLREALTWLEGAADLVSIADLLDDLSTYLIGHFAAEEAQGGLFDMIVDRAPQHRTKIDALRLDHKTLLAHVDAIRAGIESSWCPPGTEIRAKIAALVARLREHEHLEVNNAELRERRWRLVNAALAAAALASAASDKRAPRVR